MLLIIKRIVTVKTGVLLISQKIRLKNKKKRVIDEKTVKGHIKRLKQLL